MTVCPTDTHQLGTVTCLSLQEPAIINQDDLASVVVVTLFFPLSTD